MSGEKAVHAVRHRVRRIEHARAAAVARHADELAALDAELAAVRAECGHLQTVSYWHYGRAEPVVECDLCGADITGGTP